MKLFESKVIAVGAFKRDEFDPEIPVTPATVIP